jgi:hypothetical protein
MRAALIIPALIHIALLVAWIVSEIRGTAPGDGPAVSGWCDNEPPPIDPSGAGPDHAPR